MKTCVIVPAFNEATVIGRVVHDIHREYKNVIVVDDGSTDQTAAIAQRNGAHVISHMLNRGQGAALQTGIYFALVQGYDIIVTFDADGQHRVAEIDSVVKPLLLGSADVVLGSRFLDGTNTVPALRAVILRFAALLTRLYTGLRVTDTHNGFRAFSRAAAQAFELRQDGMAHASEIIEQIAKHHLRFVEVPVTIEYTTYSLHKGQHLTNAFRIFWELLLGRMSR